MMIVNRTEFPRRGCLAGLGCFLVTGVLPLTILLFVFGFFAKTTAEYACIVEAAQRHPAVVAAVGQPVSPGLFAWTQFFEISGAVRQGAFSTSLSGPLGRGRLRGEFYRAPLGATMRVTFKTDGKEIELYSGPYLCP